MNCCLKRAVNVFLLDIQRTSSAPPTATWLSMVGASTRRRCDVRKQPGLSTRLPVHRVKNVPGLYPRAVGPVSDIYSLGVLAYKALTGRQQVDGDRRQVG